MAKRPESDVMVYIGIDPGKNGGIGAIYSNGDMMKDYKYQAYAVKCPETVMDMAQELSDIKRDFSGLTDKNEHEAKLAIEKVHAFPGQGVTSMFTFGKGYGQWLGIIATLGIPYVEITPYSWQKYYGKLPKDRKLKKNTLKHYAQQRFPDLKPTLVTADAILIANWLYKVENL